MVDQAFKRNLWITLPLPPQVVMAIKEVDKCGMQSASSKTLGHRVSLIYSGKLAQAILVTPHGNADTEYLFSHWSTKQSTGTD